MINRVQNIYYMLSYAYKTLRSEQYTKCTIENFDNVADLLSVILAKGVALQLKQGIGREYVEISEPLSTLRGKIDVANSIKTLSIFNKQLVCNYDEFSINSKQNQIIKATMLLLLKQDIKLGNKKELKYLLSYFNEIDDVDLNSIDWNIRFHRNNQNYQMLINVCNLIVKGLLQTEQNGNTKLNKFIDDQKMHALYERFILEYYRKEFPHFKVSSPHIEWDLIDCEKDYLPTMKSDIVISNGIKSLIIDAKYYNKIMLSNYEKEKYRSGHLYQLFAYVKNSDKDNSGNVAGMLMYAGTDEENIIDRDYNMGGNLMYIKSINLDSNFNDIKKQLNSAINEWDSNY